MTRFVRYRLSWANEQEEHNEATFWLPEGVEPDAFVGPLINLVELDAGSECGYEYDLRIVEVE